MYTPFYPALDDTLAKFEVIALSIYPDPSPAYITSSTSKLLNGFVCFLVGPSVSPSVSNVDAFRGYSDPNAT